MCVFTCLCVCSYIQLRRIFGASVVAAVDREELADAARRRRNAMQVCVCVCVLRGGWYLFLHSSWLCLGYLCQCLGYPAAFCLTFHRPMGCSVDTQHCLCAGLRTTLCHDCESKCMCLSLRRLAVGPLRQLLCVGPTASVCWWCPRSTGLHWTTTYPWSL